MSTNFNAIPDSSIERVPPVDLEAERMCLGYMMNDHILVSYIRQHVDPGDFYRAQHQQLAKIIYSLAAKDVPPDPIAVITSWKESAVTTGKGDPAFILELYDSVPASHEGSCADSAVWYAKRVKERAERRGLLRMIAEKYSDLMDPAEEKPVDAIVGDMVTKIFEIQKTTEAVSVSKELRNIMDLIQSGDVFGISTGFPELDKFSCGYQNGEFYVIGGRPGMGKTALALKLIALLCRAGVKTMMMSIEMVTRQLLLRMLSLEAQIPYRCFRHRGAIGGSKLPAVVTAASSIAAWPLIVDDSPGLSVEQIVARVEAQVFQQGVEVVFIDHMHLIPIPNGTSPVQGLSHISLMLKTLARQMNIPVVCLAQLSRGPEGRPDPRPKLSDLRESGSIEQNADNVWFLYRDDYYDREKDNYNKVMDSELIIAKNKSLETGTIKLDFRGAYMEFVGKSKRDSTAVRG